MARRKLQEINAGSMADIAFLLLMFFLVATTIDVDTGLYRVLPAMPEEDQPEDDTKVKERNVFVVLVNRNNVLLVEGELMDLSQLKEKTIEFLLNPQNKESLPEKQLKFIEPFGEMMVTKGIISLQNDRGTNYKTYVQVMNELIAAGNYVKDQFSMENFGKNYEDLDKDERKAVREAVPAVISEAEPKNIGGS